MTKDGSKGNVRIPGVNNDCPDLPFLLPDMFPGLARIDRTEDRRAQVSGAGCHQDRAPVSWIGHDMMDDVAEKDRR